MYLVFARKYRPQTFEEVVGQEHIARTLQNAVRTGRVAHAYLFCGSRGVGKTSMARILARALNCKDGPTEHPCGKCDSCRRIATGDDLDVIEIDGASNRLVEDVEQLRQNVVYAPARSRCKVYYIDEVHMLSGHAFNALLKTLEEPPEHVKFIFSTTDPQKLPETVKSRCQRFDFRRIADAEIIKHLRRICEAESLEAEKGALESVARSARGSMRDALGTLDQLAAFGGKQVRLDDVLTVLGAARTQTLAEIVDLVAQQKTGEALAKVHEVLFSGVDLLDLIDQMSDYLRDVLVANYCKPDDELLAGSAADAETLKRQAGQFSPEQLLYMIQVLREAKLRAHRDSTGRLALELAVIKLCRLRDLVEIETALEGLSDARGAGGHAAAAPVAQAPRQETRAAPPAAPRRLVADHAERTQRMMRKLQSSAQTPAQEERRPADTPEGIDPTTFRKIQSSADDREAADSVRDDPALLNAFKQADKQFGVQPVKLKRKEKQKKETPKTDAEAAGEDQT